MIQDRKLLIVTGAVLIALIVAIAAFSLGVYLGVHGWTAGPPSVAGPGRRPPRPPDQGAAAPGAPEKRPGAPDQQPPQEGPDQPGPQVVGRVQRIDGEIIVLDTPQGVRPFRLADGVQVLQGEKGDEEPASLKEVVPGERLAVFGQFEGDGQRLLVAERLILLPPPPDEAEQERQAGPRPQLVGQVQGVSGETVTLDTPQGPRLFQLASDVQVYRRSQGQEEPALLEEVVPGEHLAVFGYVEGSGTQRLIARRLVLLPPPLDKQP